tara:strand:- start:243 stop:512 length:270 start_codon:yes stop_codon:yes gene_type:complete
MPVAEIYAPDEAMMLGRLKAAAVRHFLKLEPDVLKYLVPRLDLSYEAVETFAERLSDGVTDMGRAPSVPLVKEVLDAMEEDAEDRAKPD